MKNATEKFAPEELFENVIKDGQCVTAIDRLGADALFEVEEQAGHRAIMVTIGGFQNWLVNIYQCGELHCCNGSGSTMQLKGEARKHFDYIWERYQALEIESQLNPEGE